MMKGVDFLYSMASKFSYFYEYTFGLSKISYQDFNANLTLPKSDNHPIYCDPPHLLIKFSKMNPLPIYSAPRLLGEPE